MWDELIDIVTAQEKVLSCIFMIWVKDLRTGATWDWRANEAVPSASTIKIPIAYSALQALYGKQIREHEVFSYKSNKESQGTGILRHLQTISKLSIRDLVTLMIVISDNVAANTIIDAVGLETIQKIIDEFGLKSTLLNRKFDGYRYYQQTPHIPDNMTTASDLGLFIEGLCKRSQHGDMAAADCLQIMFQQQIRDRIPYYLPTEVAVAHKTGDFPAGFSDVGLVDVDNQRKYISSIFSNNCTTKAETCQSIAHLSKKIFSLLTSTKIG